MRLDCGMAAAFQHVQEAYQVGVGVDEGIVDAVAHTGLGRQVDDRIEAALDNQAQQTFTLGQVKFLEAEAGLTLKPGQTVGFELGLVVVVEVVDADHRVVIIQQPLTQMVANKAGRAGYQNFHCILLKKQSHPRLCGDHSLLCLKNRGRS
ncbi:MAG: hypothetical protein BWY87_01707 [Deltaproteobacteria bacterium ADurb.Bin510]|nr:MAG: hypothetical protein BWY87_01707 [Deltaproteobacteria bacterium ADurb.Bin510]